jgi:hypothetical protein
MDNEEFMTENATMAFATVKYWAREANGPREPGVRPDAIRAAVEKMVDAYEEAWRAGANRSCELQRMVFTIIRERRKSHGK